MLGWNVSVFQQINGGGLPATHESETGARIAVWQTHSFGLEWLLQLTSGGKAINLGGNGYPNVITAPAENILPQILAGPPEAHDVWIREEEDFVTDEWAGKTVIEREAAGQCRPGEWLKIVVWDES